VIVRPLGSCVPSRLCAVTSLVEIAQACQIASRIAPMTSMLSGFRPLPRRRTIGAGIARALPLPVPLRTLCLAHPPYLGCRQHDERENSAKAQLRRRTHVTWLTLRHCCRGGAPSLFTNTPSRAVVALLR